MIARTIAAVLVLVIALGGTDALANPVNAEKLRGDSIEAGWLASLDASLSMSRGNVNRTDVGHGGQLQYQTMHPDGVGFGRRTPPPNAEPFVLDRWFIVTDAKYTRVNDAAIINKGFAHMRYTRMWHPRIGSEFFLQEQYNQFTRLKARILGGVGARVDAIHRHVLQTWFGTGYMPEYELNNTVAGDPHPDRVVNHRWTNYVVVQLRLLDHTLVFRNTAYAQPRIDDFTDVRVLDELQLEARVADGAFAIGMDVGLQYDSRPPQEVRRLDVSIGSYLRLRVPAP